MTIPNPRRDRENGVFCCWQSTQGRRFRPCLLYQYDTIGKTTSYKVIDNEAKETTDKIESRKHSDKKFDLYSRRDREAVVNSTKDFEEKRSLISDENCKELERLITAKK